MKEKLQAKNFAAKEIRYYTMPNAGVRWCSNQFVAGIASNLGPLRAKIGNRCDFCCCICGKAIYRTFCEVYAPFATTTRIFVPSEEEGVSETNDDDGSSEASSDDDSEHVDSDPDVANAEDGLLDVTAIMDKIVKIHEEASELMEVAQFGPPREPGLYTMESTVFNAETVIHRRRRRIDNGKPINTGHRKQYFNGASLHLRGPGSGTSTITWHDSPWHRRKGYLYKIPDDGRTTSASVNSTSDRTASRARTRAI